MLQIKQICKEYKTGSLVQKALDHVDLNLRDNEFVAILGPSGSGKTTLLNIIGGLDRYDSGDLIINGISTKKYKDRDWDSYRNHTIGFVFQSYNLIPHQTILSNVELALTISGIGKAERRKRAIHALEQVGLGDQAHKKPNQMSGGQMQRVAIARALVNDPDILLADEPTGALDSSTSVQVMDLLRDVAKDRLVVMVTHNPELANQYATRIVELRDGKIRSDTNPFTVDESSSPKPQHKNMGKASMSFLTALSLSFNNLWTKKARTLLTSFAGSIGIIGIALILALSTGANNYIKNVEKETLSLYPLQIQKTGLDITSMLTMDINSDGEPQIGQVNVIQMVSNMFSKMDSNDLDSLKKYLDSGSSGIDQYANSIEYTYNIVPQIYRQEDGRIRQVNPDKSFEALGFGSASGTNSMMSSMMSTDVFYEMPKEKSLYEDQYDVMAGRWPENYNECVVVLTSSSSISDFMLYTLGLRDSLELDEMIRQFIDEENIDTPENMGSYSYSDFIGINFKLVNSKDYYQYDSQYQVFRDKSDDEEYMKTLVANGEDITVVGVVQPSEDANGALLSTGIAYLTSLTEHIAEIAADSAIVQKQINSKEINAFTNEPFGETSNQSDFDMKSLFTIDEKALKEAFAFDTDNLNDTMSNAFDFSNLAGTLNFSDMINLNDIDIDIPELPGMNMDDILQNVEINISEQAMQQMVTGLLKGYEEYAALHPEADITKLFDSFLKYLETDSARQILYDNILSIMEQNGVTSVSAQQIQKLISSLMLGYQKYVIENGYTDPDKFDQYLLEYLSTDEAQLILSEWVDETFNSVDLIISSQQLEKLMNDLAAGYKSYADKTGQPNPERFGEYFLDYLATEEAQQQLMSGIASMVDTEKLQQQISESIESYMQQIMTTYSSTMATAIEGAVVSAVQNITEQIGANMESAMKEAADQLRDSIESSLQLDPQTLTGAFKMTMDADELSELFRSMSTTQNATYENNLKTLGYVDFASPSGIAIYPIDFESKEQIVNILDNYNSRMESEGKDEQVITYTDMVGTLMSSVTEIIDIISYVLIAFVAISLIVSSIMIGVITYISVLERKKEIGILRAIGASKSNISQVFNAETFIIGLAAGVIGIGLSLLILIPGNALIHSLAGTNDISAVLPVVPAVILIILSVLLTLIGGLIPSRKAAKSDPVTALRTE